LVYEERARASGLNAVDIKAESKCSTAVKFFYVLQKGKNTK
jgi:hypothetical protein